MGVSGFALFCESDPVIDARCSAVVCSACFLRHRSSDVCYVGDTHLSFSEQYDVSHRKRVVPSLCFLNQNKFKHNAAVIQMIKKGRSPKLKARHKNAQSRLGLVV